MIVDTESEESGAHYVDGAISSTGKHGFWIRFRDGGTSLLYRNQF